MNSIVLQRNGSRNELSFHNFSPCSTTHFFISFTLKKRCKMVEFVEQSLKGKQDTNNTLPSNKIMKYLCTPQNACLCRCAIANFTVGAFICLFFSPTVLVIQKAYHLNASGFDFEEQQWRARIDIASSNFEENGSY